VIQSASLLPPIDLVKLANLVTCEDESVIQMSTWILWLITERFEVALPNCLLETLWTNVKVRGYSIARLSIQVLVCIVRRNVDLLSEEFLRQILTVLGDEDDIEVNTELIWLLCEVADVDWVREMVKEMKLQKCLRDRAEMNEDLMDEVNTFLIRFE
jgi:hypothetical protein